MAKSTYDKFTDLANRFRGLKSLQTSKGIRTRFLSNEDANYHTENAVLIAVFYGTDKELEETKQLIVKYMDGDNSKAYYDRCKLTSKLYDRHLKRLYNEYPQFIPTNN